MPGPDYWLWQAVHRAVYEESELQMASMVEETVALEATAVGVTYAVAVPVWAYIGMFKAMGMPYEEAQALVKDRATNNAFFQGFVMGLLNWTWGQVRNRFAPHLNLHINAFDPEMDKVEAGSVAFGLKAGYALGSTLPPADKANFLKQIRKVGNVRSPDNWRRRDQISYVIELAAAARKVAR